MCPDPSQLGKHLEYGFIEYATEEAAAQAVSAMHNFELIPGQYFRVCKAITLPEYSTFLGDDAPKPATAAAAAAAAAATQVATNAGLVTAAPVAPVQQEPEKT